VQAGRECSGWCTAPCSTRPRRDLLATQDAAWVHDILIELPFAPLPATFRLAHGIIDRRFGHLDRSRYSETAFGTGVPSLTAMRG
jgi:hypothetical protein